MDKIIIRKGKIMDSVSLRDIWIEFMEYHKRNFPWLGFDFVKGAPDVWERFFKTNVRSPKKAAFVAEVHGKLIGYLLGGIVKRPPVFTVQEVALITDLAVIKEWKNKGVGTELMKAFESWCKEKGIATITLQVANQNTNGINFYKKHNFITTMLHQKKDL
jgi:ribosomal protein S18 acetylase RimI-like enzyme